MWFWVIPLPLLTWSLFYACICSNKKRCLTRNQLFFFLPVKHYHNSTLTWFKQSQTKESKKKLPLFQQNLITHSQLGPKRSEVIGWRLATQESCTGFHFTKELSPTVLKKSPSKGQYFGFIFNTLSFFLHMQIWKSILTPFWSDYERFISACHAKEKTNLKLTFLRASSSRETLHSIYCTWIVTSQSALLFF